MYILSDEIEYSTSPITSDLFGINFVLSYDLEFLEQGPLLDLLGTLEAGNLRFPGGSTTESMFGQIDYGEANWASQYFNSMQNGVTQRQNMHDFIASAADVGATAQLVLPTNIAFTETAGQAIASGNYGTRTDIDPRYLELLNDYVNDFLSVANDNNVEVSRLEIGNEFWGSGRMTASEYGFLAATVTEYMAHHFPDLDVIAQVSYIAGFFSPVEDSPVYLMENGDDYDVYFPWQDLTDLLGLVEHVLPAQGSGAGQTQDIAAHFRNNPIALAGLDGIVDHLYFRRGLDGIDNERNFGLVTIPQTFLNASGLSEIDTFITEWSVRNISGNHESIGTHHTGLQYASSTLEAFFELAQHDVTGANFWPTTFGNENIDRRVLIDTSEQDLTFGGEIFRLLSTNLIGMTPIFDYEVNDEIDIHGFTGSDSQVFFASERSGVQSSAVIDFSNYSFYENVVISIVYLSGDGETGTEINSNPVITQVGGIMVDSTIINLELDPWAIAVINIQNITSGNDILTGTNMSDHIRADAGDDIIEGGAGNDRLRGQFGNDTLIGGVGDDSLYGGWGDDLISGGSGADFISGTFGSDTLDGGSGNDVIISSNGNSVINGGYGDDEITLGTGANIVFGEDGDDEIITSQDLSEWIGGFGAFNADLYSQTEVVQIILIDGLRQHQDVIHGGLGFDLLTLTDGADAFFLDNNFSNFHESILLDESTDGTSGVARISGIEVIDAGMGNDIIDLTSDRYLMGGERLEVHGGTGNDTIWGSAADETIIGGAGDDHLYGGRGADLLEGGAGADTFELSIFDNQDSIVDFDYSEGDQIVIYGTDEADDFSVLWNAGVIEIEATFSENTTYFRIDLGQDSSILESVMLSESLDNILTLA